MRKMWLKLKEAFFGQMAERHYRKFQKWRDRYWKVLGALDPNILPPERKEALRKEMNQMMEDLDRQEARTLNELHTKVVEEKESTRWN